VDVERQPTDLAVGFESLAARTSAQVDGLGCLSCLQAIAVTIVAGAELVTRPAAGHQRLDRGRPHRPQHRGEGRGVRTTSSAGRS